MATQILTDSLLIPKASSKYLMDKFNTIDLRVSFYQENLNIDTIRKELISKNYDLALFPLHMVPVERDKSIKIWSLLPRNKPGYILCYKVEEGQSNRIPIKDKGTVIHPFNSMINLIGKLRSDLNFKEMELRRILESLKDKKIDYAILPAMYEEHIDSQYYNVLDLNPKEFGHIPGQGFIATLGIEDSNVGNLVRNFHDKNSGRIANLERSVLKLVDKKNCVHIEQDISKNYNVWIQVLDEGNLLKSHISQSTSLKLVENALDLINHKLNN